MLTVKTGAERKLLEAKIALLFEKPFLGCLITRFPLVKYDNIPTAAIDGRNIYYNEEFINSLSKKEVIFLLAHEVMHVGFDHLGRRGDKNVKIWNMAIDYIVNYYLVENKIGQMPKGGLYSEKFTDKMTSEEVYNILIEDKNTVILDPIDLHLEEKVDKNGNKTYKIPGIGVEIGEKEFENIKNELKEAIISAAQQVGAGNVPLGVLRLIKEITNPKMNWREMLKCAINSTITDDYTFKKLSPLTWSNPVKAILPSTSNMEVPDIVVFIDGSGSISDEMISNFLGEVAGIMNSYPGSRISIGSFDTEVYNFKVFEWSDYGEITKYEVKGGGGTDFMCCYNFMKNNNITPKLMIMFTDGLPFGEWGDKDYCDALFIIHSNPNVTPPFGNYAHYS